MEGNGISKVDIDFKSKSATVRYDAGITKATDALSRLTANAKYSKSTIESLSAEFTGDYAHVTATAELPKGGKGAKGKLHVVIEPKGVVLNGSGQPELEIEATPKDGVTFKTPVLKDKNGVKKPRELVIEFTLDDKAKAGEVGVPIELRLVVVKGKETASKVVQMTVPVLIP